MKIEKAEINNAEEILILQKLAYQSEAKLVDDFDIPPLKQTLYQIKKQFSDRIFLKAVEKNNIIGSVRAFEKNGICFIERLIVHPDRENKGIGTKLMNEIENYFKKINRFELFTGSKSKKNIYLYSKLGYKIFKTEKLNDKVTFVYMEKKI